MRSQNAIAERNLANAVMCPACFAAPDDVCTRRDSSGRRVAVSFPAHAERIRDARKAREAPNDNDGGW